MNLNPKGYYTPCCSSDYQIADSEKVSIFEAWKAERYKEIRRAMLAGSWHPACHECKVRESDEVLKNSEYRSARHNFNRDHVFSEDWGSLEISEDPPLALTELELDFSNLCNLKCNMCGSHNSTSWVEDEKALGKEVEERYRKRKPTTQREFDEFLAIARPAKVIRFKGGEPFLIKEPLLILERLAEESLTEKYIHFVTNGTVLKESHLQILSKFQQVDLEFSLDATGLAYQYMRGGKKYPFESVEKNIFMASRALKTDGVQFTFNTTYQNLNAFNLLEFTRWFYELSNQLKQKHSLIRSILTGPNYYQCSNLPDPLKEIALAEIDLSIDFMKSNRHSDKFVTQARVPTVLENCKQFMTQSFDPSLWSEFVSITSSLDRIRRMNIQDFNPIFAPFFGDVSPEAPDAKL